MTRPGELDMDVARAVHDTIGDERCSHDALGDDCWHIARAVEPVIAARIAAARAAALAEAAEAIEAAASWPPGQPRPATRTAGWYARLVRSLATPPTVAAGVSVLRALTDGQRLQTPTTAPGEFGELGWELLLHTLDRAGLIEHGTSVYGPWITDKGRRFLTAMDTLGDSAALDALEFVGYSCSDCPPEAQAGRR